MSDASRSTCPAGVERTDKVAGEMPSFNVAAGSNSQLIVGSHAILLQLDHRATRPFKARPVSMAIRELAV